MIVTDFMRIFADTKIPTIARNVTDRAVAELLKGNERPIDVTEVEWSLIARYSGLEPHKSGKYTFIRIHADGKEKDIQILNDHLIKIK